MRIAIYSRKSRFTGKGESIGNQVQLCKEYIAANIGPLDQQELSVYEDEGFSGKNLDRPRFQNMMSDAGEKPFDYIICYRLDRISRSVSDFSGLIETLARQKTAFVCIREQFDTSTPMGKAMMYIASVFAQLERETIAERIRDNLFLLSRDGRWLGGTTPLGYYSEKVLSESSDGKTRSCFRLVPLLDEQKIVTLLYGQFQAMQSLSAVAKYCVSHSIRTRRNKEFTLFSVREILTNPVYCIAENLSFQYFQAQGCDLCACPEDFDTIRGYMPYRRTSHQQAYQGKTGPSEWVIALGAHPGLIPGQDWVKTQQIINAQSAHGTFGKRKTISSPALLSGLLKCASCGGTMRPHVHSARSAPDGIPPYYYICETKERSGHANCTMHNVPGSAADHAIAAVVFRYLNQSMVYDTLAKLPQENQQHMSDSKTSLIEAAIDEQEKQIHNLLRSLAKGEIDDYSATLIREEINLLHQQCDTLKMEKQAFPSTCPEHDSLAVILNDPWEIWELVTVAERKELLRSLITSIYWQNGELQITWLPPADH